MLNNIKIAGYISFKEQIILLHGIMRSSWHMKSLARFLEKNGFEVINVKYPSTKYDLEALAESTWENLKPKIKSNTKIHFVGYSMGGLLSRVIINKYKPENLGRTVLIGVPNNGSEVADLLKDNFLYKKFFGPSGQQLIIDQTKFSYLFGEVDYEVGCIAGTLGIYPSSLLFKSKNDGRVSLESTKIIGMSDHIEILNTHAYLPRSQKVQHHTLNFLKNGRF